MTASSRRGRKIGPGTVRSRAMPRPQMRTSTSAIRKSWTLTTKPWATYGRARQKYVLLKNASRTSGQLAELTTIQPSSPKTAMTLPTPTSTPRRPDGRLDGACGDPRWKGGSSPRPMSSGPDDPPPSPWLMAGRPRLWREGRCVSLGRDPVLAQRGQRAVGLQGVDRPVDAGGQGAALVEEDREGLGRAHRRE